MTNYLLNRSNVITIIILLFTGNLLRSQDGLTVGAPKIAYWKQGFGSTTVIVIHGGPSAAHNYLLPEWNILGTSATLVYYDQRGCGKSENATCYSWKEHVVDLRRLIEKVSRNKKVILAGSSWGSTLALLYTHSFPDDIQGLILSGTYNWGGRGEPEKPCDDYLNPFLRFAKDTVSYKAMKVFDSDNNPLQPGKIIEVHHISSSITNGSMRFAPPLVELSKINQPVLVFKGEANCKGVMPEEGADIYSAILPNVEVFTIEGGCHDPWITHPRQFFSKCMEFIKATAKK